MVLPPAAGTVQEIVEDQKWELDRSTVAIVGLGLLVGRPVATWIMRRAKETILLGSASDFGLLKHADLVVTGVGKAGLVSSAMLKGGAGVIDFGYGTQDGTYTGDFDARGLSRDSQLAFYTPTPGGTGPILVAKIFENFYALNE